MIPAGFIIPHVCPTCGNRFQAYRSQNRKHCSPECSYAGRVSNKTVQKCARHGCKNTFIPQVKYGKVQRYCCLQHRHPTKR